MTRKALIHIRDCLYLYYSTAISSNIPQPIQWIDLNVSLDFLDSENIIDDLTFNLDNRAAMDNLANKLYAAGAFGDLRKDFYLWHTDPRNWSDMSYQARSVDCWPLKIYKESQGLYLPPPYLALGAFTINALPEGYVQPKGNGNYDICISKVYIFANDKFNFEGDAPLGSWDLDEFDYNNAFNNQNVQYPPATSVSNKHFRDYQRHGYGHEVTVLSKLREVEGFQPICKTYTLTR